MIQVEHLTKLYGAKTAIADVSFSVEKGEVLAFLGPNGAGKTTTMRILTASLPATSGSVKIAGYDCFDQPKEVKRLIGYLPEVPPLYTEMTVTEYLTFVGRIKGIEPQPLPVALDQVLERMSLGEVRGRLIANLSRGFRQRVGLAQALIHDPPILILDEPTVGLDPKQIIEIRQLIRDLAGARTIILSTHILPEATAVAKRVVIINDGRIVAEDTQDQLSARLRRSEKVSLTLTGLLSFLAVATASNRSMQMLRVQGNLPELNLNEFVFRPVFYNMAVILLLVVPILTMRLFAEEKKLKTMELLVTSPVTITDIVVGKFVAALAVLAGMLALSAVAPVALAPFAEFRWPPILTAYLGVLLMGGLFLSAGLLGSSLTENQIIAVILSFGALLLFWLFGWAGQVFAGTALGKVLSYLSPLDHFDQLVKGLVETKDLVYFVAGIVFTLFLTHRVIESQRWR